MYQKLGWLIIPFRSSQNSLDTFRASLDPTYLSYVSLCPTAAGKLKFIRGLLGILQCSWTLMPEGPEVSQSKAKDCCENCYMLAASVCCAVDINMYRQIQIKHIYTKRIYTDRNKQTKNHCKNRMVTQSQEEIFKPGVLPGKILRKQIQQISRSTPFLLQKKDLEIMKTGRRE